MPTENENKYVLSRDFSEAGLKGWERVEVEQAYPKEGGRVRRSGDQYYFTFKIWSEREQRQVEIEKHISKRDYDTIAACCDPVLRKTRYVKHMGAEEWVVDFLRGDDASVYFILAEVEMPEGQREPQSIPAEIAAHIIHSAYPGDSSLSSKKLMDRDYARQLYARLTMGG